MICVNLYCKNKMLWRFRIEGHSGYAEHGSDIICAAVSTLVFNTVNAIEAFTTEPFNIHDMDPNLGLLDCEFPKRKLELHSEQATLLLDTMLLGLETIQQTYGENYIQFKKIGR